MACTLHGLSKDVTCPDTSAMLANQRIIGIISDVSYDEKTGTTSFMLGGSKLQIINANLPKGALMDGQEIEIEFGANTTITVNRKPHES